MDFANIPVFGQSVKPGLGLRFRGNYWAFFERRTQLSPWLALHRESVNDTELDKLLMHGFPRTRTGDTVDCKVLTHFGLTQGDLYEDGFFVGRTERQRTAALTGDVLVIKIPLSANPERDLLNPNSIYWASESRLLMQPAGSPEHERSLALIEMATILLARWREHDSQNLEFKVQNRIKERWQEGQAIGQGAGAAAMGFIEGLWDLIKISVEFTTSALKATCAGLHALVTANFSKMQHMLQQAGLAVYNTAQELIAALEEGMRLFNLIGSDRLLRTGLFEFLDGYTESVPHLRRLRNASTVVVTIGIEVLLAIVTVGGSLAVGAARVSARAAQAARTIGPFTNKAIASLARFANALERARAPKLRASDGPPARSSTQAGKGNSPGNAAGNTNSSANTGKNSNTESQVASTPKVADTKTAGEPVSMINGEELLQLQDCTLSGLIGLNWQRTYRSSLAETGFNTSMGAGWAHPLAKAIEPSAQGGLEYLDEEGRRIAFTALQVGQQCTNRSEFLTLLRSGPNQYRLQISNGLGPVRVFEAQQSITQSQTHRLVRIEDAFGNTLHIDYAEGRPTRIRSSQSTWLLGYNSEGLLAQIAQLATGPEQAQASDETDTPRVELQGLNQIVLVQYHYNAQQQLVTATDAAGHTE